MTGLRARPARASRLIPALALLATIAVCAGAAAGKVAVEPPATAPVTSIPFTLEENKIVIEARLDRSGPLRMVLDTGMTRGALLNHPGLAREAGLETHGSRLVGGVGGGTPVRAGLVRGVKIRIGAVELPHQSVLVMPAGSEYSRFTDPLPFDGIVGHSLLERFVCRIDYDRMTLALYDPKTYVYRGDGSTLGLTLEAQKPYVLAGVELADGKRLEAKLVVDTGASGALSLIPGSDPRIVPPAITVEATLGRGIQGKRRGRVGRVAGLQLGRYRLTDALTTFPFEPIRGLSRDRNGLIGNGVLKRFNLTFDYSRKQMILERNERFDEPFEYDMVGLQLDPVPGDGGLTIHEVLDASPADEAGILAGDILLAVDGRAAVEIPLARLREGFKDRPGKPCELRILRAGEERVYRVQLRRLI